jgi:hypothetical protein
MADRWLLLKLHFERYQPIKAWRLSVSSLLDEARARSIIVPHLK